MFSLDTAIAMGSQSFKVRKRQMLTSKLKGLTHGTHKEISWELPELFGRVLSKTGIPNIVGTDVEKYHFIHFITLL